MGSAGIKHVGVVHNELYVIPPLRTQRLPESTSQHAPVDVHTNTHSLSLHLIKSTAIESHRQA